MLKFSETPSPDGAFVEVFLDQERKEEVGTCFIFAGMLILAETGKEISNFDEFYWSMS